METERRQHPRLPIHTPALALLGESKVGLLFDLGEGGLSIRGVIPETEAEFHFVSFGLPGTDRFVNARAEIAWSSRSEQRTGLRFVQMATTSRQKLREWLVFEARLEKTNAKSDVKAVREQCARHEAEFKSGMPITKEILLSLIAGISVTVLLSVFRAMGIAPDLIDMLLSSGSLLERKAKANGILAVLGDAIIFGSLPFVVLRLRSWRHPQSALVARAERRRAQRVPIAVPVFVYGWLRQEPFSETTETLDISAGGGLLPLSKKLAPSQKLVVTNMQTDTDSLCRVVRLAKARDKEMPTGIEFVKAPADFWAVIESRAVTEPTS